MPVNTYRLTKNQLEYLKLISGFHALTLKTIATKLKKSESSAKQTLKRLEENEYIKSRKTPPGKYGVYFYWVTSKSKRLIE